MFAQAVLDGLVGGADEDKNGAVDIQELAQFVKINVTQRTAGRQRPLIARPSLVPKFVVSGL
jgi:hypothetical protein